MGEKKVKCPKCSHEQRGRVECEACGVIFGKYIRFQQKQKEQEAAEKARKANRSKTVSRAFMVVLLILCTASVTYYFAREKAFAPGEQAQIVQQTVDRQETAAQPAPVRSFPDQPVVRKAAPLTSGTNTIEQARNATVSVETPWGTGSGFFVNENYIVTNRHVVEFNPEQLGEFRNKVETNRRLIDLEKKKIREMKQKIQEIPKGPSRSQLAIIIEKREEELEKMLPGHEEAEQRLEELEQDVRPSDIKIILADGSTHSANYLLVSENHDLALMSLFSSAQSFLRRPPSGQIIHQGDKVYTIGSPVGLRHTVTAGVFSGYRKRENDGKVFLQTDAPINPGNSGGPLIDERGYVYGVNTMILQNTEGIGFAIPIDTVFDEFSSTLY